MQTNCLWWHELHQDTDFIKVEQLGIYFVLAYITHNHECTIDLRETSSVSSGFRRAPFTPRLSVCSKQRSRFCCRQSSCTAQEQVHSTALKRGVCLWQRPGQFTPEKKTQHPLYKRLSGPWGWSDGSVTPCSHWGSSPTQSSWQGVAIPTTLSRPPSVSGRLTVQVNVADCVS